MACWRRQSQRRRNQGRLAPLIPAHLIAGREGDNFGANSLWGPDQPNRWNLAPVYRLGLASKQTSVSVDRRKLYWLLSTVSGRMQGECEDMACRNKTYSLDPWNDKLLLFPRLFRLASSPVDYPLTPQFSGGGTCFPHLYSTKCLTLSWGLYWRSSHTALMFFRLLKAIWKVIFCHFHECLWISFKLTPAARARSNRIRQLFCHWVHWGQQPWRLPFCSTANLSWDIDSSHLSFDVPALELHPPPQQNLALVPLARAASIAALPSADLVLFSNGPEWLTKGAGPMWSTIFFQNANMAEQPFLLHSLLTLSHELTSGESPLHPAAAPDWGWTSLACWDKSVMCDLHLLPLSAGQKRAVPLPRRPISSSKLLCVNHLWSCRFTYLATLSGQFTDISPKVRN